MDKGRRIKYIQEEEEELGIIIQEEEEESSIFKKKKNQVYSRRETLRTEFALYFNMSNCLDVVGNSSAP